MNRQRSAGFYPGPVLHQLKLHQAIYDAHQFQNSNWHEQDVRVARVNALISLHPSRCAELATETAKDQSEIRELDARREDGLHEVNLQLLNVERSRLVDQCTNRVQATQSHRSALNRQLREELGRWVLNATFAFLGLILLMKCSPWTLEEQAHWERLAELDKVEDGLHDIILDLTLRGWVS